MSLSSSSSKPNYIRNENIYDNTSDCQSISKTKNNKISIECLVFQNFKRKYILMPFSYNLNIIDNIIYNDKTHIVSLFKDYLILDDKGEFLKRFYTNYESNIRLPKFFEFYELNSKIFPNYTSIKEGKYFYRNIQQKQKMINIQEKMKIDKKRKYNNILDGNSNSSTKSKIFSTNIMDSFLNDTNNEGMELLFNINLKNINQEERSFNNKINNLIDEINKCKNNDKLKEFKNNLNNKENETSQNQQYKYIIQKKNKDILYFIKNKKKLKNVNNNKNFMNDINQKRESNINSFVKFLSDITQTKNMGKLRYINNIKNVYNNNYVKINLHHKNKVFDSKKLKPINDKTLVDKLEQNFTKIRAKFVQNYKNISQNISTSFKTNKDISSTKKNKSMKKQNSMSTFNYNFNNRLTYLLTGKSSISELKNSKKESNNNKSIKYYLSSRNLGLNFSSYITNHKKTNYNISNFDINNINKMNISTNSFNIGNINSSRNKSIKNINITKINEIKHNYNDSRNQKLKKNNLSYIKRNSNNKMSVLSFTKNIYNCNDSKDLFNLTNKSKTKIQYNNSNYNLKNFGYKKIDSKKRLIKHIILNNGFKINSSRNNKVIFSSKNNSRNLNNSKIKNYSFLKIGIQEDLKDTKKDKIKNIKITKSHLVKILNNIHKNKNNSKTKKERKK